MINEPNRVVCRHPRKVSVASEVKRADIDCGWQLAKTVSVSVATVAKYDYGQEWYE